VLFYLHHVTVTQCCGVTIDGALHCHNVSDTDQLKRIILLTVVLG